MEKTQRGMVEKQAEHIRNQIEGVTTLYGLPYDRDDADMVIVAAYFLGQNKQLKLHIRDLESPEHLF